MTGTPKQDDVRLYEGNCGLKRVVGKEFVLGDIPEGQVEACQGILDAAALQFFTHGIEDVAALEALVVQMEALEDGVFFTRAGQSAHNLRGQAEILGFTLITTITRQMIESIEHAEIPAEKKRQLVARITEVLRLAFEQRIRDAGGAHGEEVLTLLEGYLRGRE